MGPLLKFLGERSALHTQCAWHIGAFSLVGCISLLINEFEFSFLHLNFRTIGLIIWTIVTMQLLSVLFLAALFGSIRIEWKCRTVYGVFSLFSIILSILCAVYEGIISYRGPLIVTGLIVWILHIAVILYMSAWFSIITAKNTAEGTIRQQQKWQMTNLPLANPARKVTLHEHVIESIKRKQLFSHVEYSP